MRAVLGLFLSIGVPLLGCADDGESGGAGGASAQGGQGGHSSAGGGAEGGAAAGAGGTGGAASVDCDALPPPSGSTISVDPSQAASLAEIVGGAPAGSTIVLSAGTYPVPAILQIHEEGVTIRSADDDASSVILDGQYQIPELFQVTSSGVTIAHVTLTHAVDHLVHAFPPAEGVNITGLRLYAVRMVDSGEQFLKVNPIGDQAGYVDDGRVECSSFEMTSEGRAHVEPCCGGCYTGGIDVHSAQGWLVARNRFEGIHCEGAGLAEHAIHFWKGSRDTVVENNVITDCARGIGFGLEGGAGTRVYPDNPQGGALLAHYDGVIRNNVILAGTPYFDTGIEIDEAREPHVLHNTVIATSGATGFFSSIDYRFASTSAVIKNNLVNRISQRDGAAGDVSNNLEDTPEAYFVDVTGGDLHLTDGAAMALDLGAPQPDAGVDIDGDPHDPQAPDIGADER